MVLAKKRTGINLLNYMGVDPNTPIKFTVQKRDPTARDYSNWNIGSEWLNKLTQDLWKLVNKDVGVATWILCCGSNPSMNTITGNTGGPVSADASNNVDIISGFSPLSVDGNPGTNTLIINSDGIIIVQIDADSGSAASVSGIINVSGGTNVSTSAAGNTITINVDADTIADQYDTDSGSAVPSGGIIEFLGGTNIATIGSGNTVTANVVADTIADQYDTDSGSAVPSSGVINIVGGSNISTSGSGNTVTVDVDPDTIVNQYDTDSGSAVPSSGIIDIVGDGEVTTSGAGNTVTISAGGFYEEGTWTPSIEFGGGSTGITYAKRVGYYMRLGNFTFLHFYMRLSSKGSSTGNLSILGIPFPSSGTIRQDQGDMPAWTLKSMTYSSSSFNRIHAWAAFGTSVLHIYETSPSGVVEKRLTNSRFSNDSEFGFDGFYQISG